MSSSACDRGRLVKWAPSSPEFCRVQSRDSDSSGTVTGDLLVAQVTARGGTGVTITAPAGWSTVSDTVHTTLVRQGVYRKAATASEPASYAFGLSTTQTATGGISSFAGANTAAPIDGSSVGGDARDVIDRHRHPGSGMTERYDTGILGTNVASQASTQVMRSSGATGNRVATASPASTAVNHLVALEPFPTSTVRYGFTGSGDTPEVATDTSGNVTERYITLPGGVLLTKRSAGDVWSIPTSTAT